uniref:Chondroitin sulfate proteoglycan 4-like n=1 Tax=Poecilia reticulata TaxID=8081 RepID=A0A3P9NFA6_POERE
MLRHLPLVFLLEKSIQTLIHVRFHTSSQSGLLLLAAGQRDFLLLELISGCLQVRLNLGSGERLLRSERGIHLNDLAWHTVDLNHTHHNINMIVDRSSHTTLRMPGPDLELSIEDGLFVGGTAGLKHPYLLNISTGFRGCLDEAVFNEHNLLSSLQPYSGYKSIHEVSLGCSPQFLATEEDPVRFSSSKAFISLPQWEVLQEGTFECELHPSWTDENGLVLYSSGSDGGFVSIEIRDGHLVASIGNGKGSKTELHSLTHVYSKHTWYPIQLLLQPDSIQLKVGKELVKASLSQELQAIQPKGPLVLGGLDDVAVGKARSAGLASVPFGEEGGGRSFKGCLQKIRVNTQKTGLPHAMVTKDITVGCNIGQAPKVVIISNPTDLPDFDVTTTQMISNKRTTNLLVLRTLEVAEGGQTLLEPKHVRVNIDFRKLGIHSSELMCRAKEKDRSFSMLDLWRGRVMYVHSGSEDQNDFFMFSIFFNNKKPLPVLLEDNHVHRFNISITPVNDPPVLSLPQGNLFTLPEKSKRQVDMLRVSDPDNSPEDLVFNSMGNLNSEAGYLENLDYPGRPINLFSLSDLEEGKISFVHTGVSASRLVLRASDGHRVSNAVVLRIMAVTLEYKLVNKTGLEVNQGESAIISTRHLAVRVSVADSSVDVWYDVTDLPQFGEIQRLHSSGEWKSTTFFSQKILEKERIRYISTYRGIQTQSNITDQFKCKIVINSVAKEEVVFPIEIRWIQFKVTRSKMEVTGLESAVLTPEDLHVISKGVKISESDLFYKVLTAPKKGRLFLNQMVLQKNSNFSQENITEGLVKYELFNRLHDDTRDVFSFQVFSAHAASTPYDFRINIKAESSAVTIINKGLLILEGASKVITKDILFTHTASNREVLYNVTVSPKHGQLRKINLSNSTSINDNILTFSNQDITEERIMYVHDDSETRQDYFTFQIAVYKPHKNTNKKEDGNTEEHMFNISVQLVNDQRPVRVVDEVFHVARDGQRLVTLKDLRYRDDDSDFEDSWLVYTRRGIPMGELVLASDPSHRLYEFTQRDLEQVLFIHSGVSFGRFVLFVTDGKHYVSALLEVMAQDPYLQVENNTGLMVQQGGIAALTSVNLSVISNLDIRDPQEVTFEIYVPPKHGVLCFNDGQKEAIIGTDAISVFTQRDLVAGRLAYHHSGGHELSTERRTERGRRDVHLDIGVPVKIYLESHHRPPTIKTNPHHVYVSMLLLFCQQQFPFRVFLHQVVHEDSLPSDIVFTVQEPPIVGIIYRVSGSNNLENVHREKQDLEKVCSLLIGPIRVMIDIIPILLPLKVLNLTLDEGSSLPLTSSIIKVASHHFAGLNFLYQVIAPPRFGHLEHSRIPGMPINAFTHTEVELEYISYVHDGSETLKDNFTIVANQTEMKKHSLPCTVYITVTPVNDETPAVTTNRGLKVWVGSVTEISTNELSADDVDTPPEGLEFVITPPSNGHLALKSAPSRHILNFTQNHIQSRMLIGLFNLSYPPAGALSGGFHFQVNDGVNFAPRQIFSTTAHDLVLTLQKNHPMEVYPGIPHSSVLANDISSQLLSVVFAVTAPPKFGRLVLRMPDNSFRNISTFTQSMVSDGLILYDQNQPESVGWSAADSFSFTVSSPPAFLPPHTFTLLISYQANEHLGNVQHRTRLLNNAGAVVAEGGRVTIDRSKLDASNLLGNLPESHRKNHHIMYRVISLPRHGALTIQGHNLTSRQSDFSQATLNKFGIMYLHDDSETTKDSFTFRAWVAPLHLPSSSSSLSLVAVTEMFNITVTPVNDHPPLIRIFSDNPLIFFKVEDHDTPPEELHYLVISKPNNGYLTLGERPEIVTSFTQYDVNHGRLHFTQQLFSMEVVKPSVSMVNNTGLSLVQGRTAVVLTTNQLAAQTNGQRQANISYTVTKHPRHGRIAINDQEVTTFRHEDLQFGRVVYHMTDLSESEDSFQVSVSAWSAGVDYGRVTGQTVNVTVRPLIYLREPVRVPSGIAVKLGKAMIDASELARISRVDPVFEVLSPPKHGKLVKVNPFDMILWSITHGASHERMTPHLGADNRTTLGAGHRDSVGHSATAESSHPHILSNKNHNKTQRKAKPHSRWGNRTRSHGGRSGSIPEVAVEEGHTHAPQPHTPPVPEVPVPISPPIPDLVQVEILPRPASDPLLIILPLLACLLLIIILVVLILVFRHRKEKQARQRLMHELAAMQLPTEDSPYLGQPERSMAMPNVLVTQLGSASCPTSPRIPMSPRRSLAPGMTFWGPFESNLAGRDGNIRGRNNSERDSGDTPQVPPAGFKTSWRSQSPTLKDSQYWV